MLLLQVMFAMFAVITAAWTFTLVRSKRANVYKIHWLMLGLVVCKTLTLLAQAIMFLVIERQGSAHGWNWVYYTITFLRGTLFFAVIVLIGTGWSYMKPFVDDNTRKVLMIVLPLQVSICGWGLAHSSTFSAGCLISVASAAELAANRLSQLPDESNSCTMCVMQLTVLVLQQLLAASLKNTTAATVTKFYTCCAITLCTYQAGPVQPFCLMHLLTLYVSGEFY